MRTSRLCSLWPDMRSLRFRRVPFGRDVAFDPGGATASRVAMPHILPSTVPSVSASATLFLSWLNPPPHPITVYASHPPSPTTAQHSLPGGALLPYRGRSFTGRNASASPDAPELKFRIQFPPAESRANFQPGWATKRRTSVSKPAASVAVCRRQVAWRHLGNPESKGRGRSSEVGDLHVQRGAKVLAGDKLPFIHLTELDIVKVGMSGGSNASGRSAFREETFAFGHTSGSAGADASQTLELRDRNGSSTAH